MSFKYKHSEERTGAEAYNRQLIRWLIIKGFINSDKDIKILDLGSGRGYFYFFLKELGYRNVYAADLCPAFKECTKADITKKLPYKDDSFDLVISRDIAEHIRESGKFFSEQHRVLNKGGRIIAMTPNAQHMSLGDFYEDYTHVMPYTPKSLHEALEMHGFRNVTVQKLRAVPQLWKYTPKAFDYLYSKKKNNLLGAAQK